DALLHLGSIKFGEGKFADAEPLFRQLVAAYPNHTKALNHLVNALLYLDKIDEAEALSKKAYGLEPGDFETILTYGLVLQERGKSSEAEALFRQAVALNPNSAEAWNNVGMSLQFQGRAEDAITCYEKANVLKPAFAGAYTNKAQSLMALGRLSEGWDIYRHRFENKTNGANRRGYLLPLWSGKAADGLKLLVWTDQGLGDELLYASMLPDLQKRGIDVVLECSERLVPLFKRSFPGLPVVPRRTPPDAAIQSFKPNTHISLAELGALFRPRMSSFPPRRGYLRPDPDRTAAIRSRYRAVAGSKPLIGVSWKSENPKTGKFKSVAADQWRELLAGTDAYFVSLQYGDDAADLAVISDGGRVQVFKDPDIDPVADVDHFAAQVAALDFVITVSNTTAHVAGGLNVPVWLLAPQGQGMLWYWFFDGAYSPWYASMRIFRQARPGVWSHALEEIAANLKSLNVAAS
ncbi:MAG: glycosyltransferase family protein, partial [Rhodospirillaceae bacterium]|nr:glycosyltransferase family protein [Rhodospirillaceae bacterium]